jgi:hypothetical protein
VRRDLGFVFSRTIPISRVALCLASDQASYSGGGVSALLISSAGKYCIPATVSRIGVVGAFLDCVNEDIVVMSVVVGRAFRRMRV